MKTQNSTPDHGGPSVERVSLLGGDLSDRDAGRGGAFPVAVVSVGCCSAESTVCCLWGK